MAIYFGLLAFGLAFAAAAPRRHWLPWIIAGPDRLRWTADHRSSQFSWTWLSGVLPYRESTAQLRVITGLLFGVLTAWFAYPSMEASMADTGQLLARKLAVNRAEG
jgi:hypothetical protein